MPTTFHFPELAERVRGQRTALPAVYGDVDFDASPYRLALDPEDESSLPNWAAPRDELLADERAVELMATGTMLGDVVADAYAALMEKQSFKLLIEMLTSACRDGIEAVPDAPPELERFIESMEAEPDWIDMDLVEKGARSERIPQALLAPYFIRGAFMATFLNTYAALPMALTGALGGRKAARRVNETASFFAVTTMPRALERFGRGFEAAAMVRLMHSMVRYNALKKSDWDLGVYGIPIPQVDQMPAGLINVYLLSRRVLDSGRTDFDDRERAVVEFSRYRCFLLGLPRELLPDTPEELVHVMHARAATLRDGFDDEICGELVRATMDAYLKPSRSLPDRLAESIERSYGKFFFTRTFLGGKGGEESARMGLQMGVDDYVRVGLFAPLVFGSFFTAMNTSRLPIAGAVTDRLVTEVLKLRLASYGTPEFTTDAKSYRRRAPKPAPAST